MRTWVFKFTVLAPWLGLVVVLPSGCLGRAGPATNRQALLQQGQRAYREGRVLKSYRLLSQVCDSDQTESDSACATLDQATQGAEHLIARWIEQGEFWVSQGNHARAVAYYRDLAEQLPKNDPLRRRFEDRASSVKQQLAQKQDEVEQLLASGRQAFYDNRYAEAHQFFQQARFRAVEHNLAISIADETLLTECERRIQGPAINSTKARTASMKSESGYPEPATGSNSTHAATGSDPAGVWLAMAQHNLTKKMNKFILMETLNLLRRVLRVAPGHPEAQRALNRALQIRKQMVSDVMKTASEHFAREELDKAAPYYRDVLELQPGHLRASEGLQMYNRLKEIKKKGR